MYGVVYALYALGFSVLFGVAGIPNLSYGIFYTFTAYIIYILTSYHGCSFVIATLIAIVATVLLSLVVNEVAVIPVLRSPVAVFITTLATAYMVQEYIRIKYGLLPSSLPFMKGSFNILGVYVQAQWVIASLIGVVAVITLVLLLKYTGLGVSIRAVAESWEEASLKGVDPVFTLRITSIIAGVYAGIAAVALAPLRALTPEAGWSLLFIAFAIVILGGMGSITGTVLGSFIYAYVEQIVAFIVNQTMAAVVPLVVVIVMLIVKPTGLLGERVEEG